MQTLDLELRDRVGGYVAGRVPLVEFRSWLVHEGWNADKRTSAAAAELIHEVELLLSEFEHGDWTEQELKEQLTELFEYPVSALPGVAVRSDSSASDIVWARLTVAVQDAPPLEFFDIRFVEASA